MANPDPERSWLSCLMRSPNKANKLRRHEQKAYIHVDTVHRFAPVPTASCSTQTAAPARTRSIGVQVRSCSCVSTTCSRIPFAVRCFVRALTTVEP